jgi:hypothetical protein
MHSKQRGMTFIGIVILVAVFGLIGFGVIQLVPVYLENMKVVQSVNQVKVELDSNKADAVAIRKALRKRFVVEDLRDMDVKKDFIIERVGVGYRVTADYERRRPYLANIYLLAEFEHSVEIVR